MLGEFRADDLGGSFLLQVNGNVVTCKAGETDSRHRVEMVMDDRTLSLVRPVHPVHVADQLT
jgi:hypothetical protein